MSMSRAWSLEDGLTLVRALQPNTKKFGYHLTLGGSVLNNGSSEKDVDLYFLPLENKTMPTANPTSLVEWLEKMWGTPKNIGKEYDNDHDPTGPNVDIETPEARVAPTPPQPFPADPNAPPRFYVSRNLAVPAPLTGINRIISSTTETFFRNRLPAIRTDGAYKYKLQFNRRGDRIDVFVL